MKTRTGLALIALVLYAGVQKPFLFAPDYFNSSEGVYWQTLRQMGAGRHLYSEIFYSQWPLFIELARLGRFLPWLDLHAARVMIFLFAPLCLFLMFRLGRRSVSPVAGLAAAALLAADPLFFALSHQLTGEIPALALTLLGLVLIVERPFARALMNAALVGLCFGVAVQVKALMGLPIALVLAFQVWFAAKASLKVKAPPAVAAVLPAAVTALTAALINIFCFYAYGWFSGGGWEQLQGGLLNAHASHPGGANWLRNFRALWGTTDYSRGFWLLTLPALALGLNWLWYNGEKRLARPLLIAVVGAFAVLLLQFKVNTDHLILFSPVAALVAGVFFARRPQFLGYGLATLIAINAVANAYEYGWGWPKGRKRDSAASQALEMLTRPGDVVMGNQLFLITAAGKMTPPEYADFSAARALSGSLNCDAIVNRLEQGDVKAFVLLNKNLDGLNCGTHGDLEHAVRTRFPRLAYGDGRNTIWMPAIQNQK